ncbi:hypothetical protein DH2020_008851 [Rehmannia glutinosa]|uniref:Cystatin domain-containing protein n=1 Tax=Rehmannia glutinosa TaxID=99300 RepID=A0ABR0X4M3_REHGL
MALKLSFVLFLSILVASVSLLASAADLGDRQAPVPGGWLDIDPNNPQVVEFAKFAVSEHNREAKTTLQFVKVINVKVASVSLLASAADLGGRQAPVPGGWPGIDPNNPRVVEFAKFAVAEHNREAGTTLQFVKVINVKDLISTGVAYKLVISARVSNKSSTTNEYEAVVSQPNTFGGPLKLVYFRALYD